MHWASDHVAQYFTSGHKDKFVCFNLLTLDHELNIASHLSLFVELAEILYKFILLLDIYEEDRVVEACSCLNRLEVGHYLLVFLQLDLVLKVLSIFKIVLLQKIEAVVALLFF